MSVIYGPEDFEHSGSAPSGWFVSSGWAAGTTVAKSGSYEWAQGSSSSTQFAGPSSTDATLGSATPGNMKCSVWFYVTSTNTTGYIGVYLRMSTDGFSGSGYRFDMISGSQMASIQRGTSGSYTSLASRTTTYSSGWYQAVATANGSTLTLAVQRGSDGLWLQTDGTWGSSQVSAISTTDTTYAAGSASYCGLVYYGTGGSGAGLDLFQLEDLSGPTTVNGTAAMVGDGLLSATGNVVVLGSGQMVGISSLAAAAQVIVQGSAAMNGVALLTPAGLVITPAIAAMAGIGRMSATPGALQTAQAAMVSVGALQENGNVIVVGQAAMVGDALLQANTGPAVIQGSAHLIGCALQTAFGHTPHVPLLVLKKRARRL